MKKLFITLILVISAATCGFAAEISTEAKTYYNRGVDYYKLGQYDNAITSFREAINIAPEYIDAYYNLGSILEFLKQNDAALAVFKQIITRKPTDYESVYKAALLSAKLDRLDDAKKFIASIPSSSLAYAKAQKLSGLIKTQTSSTEVKPADNPTSQEPPKKGPATEPKGQDIPQTNGVYTDLSSPTGIAVDARGNLFIAGFADNTIFKILPDGTKRIYVKNAKIQGPIGIAIDSNNNLYVANYNADNVLKITPKGEISAIINDIKKPYCIYIKDNLLFVSSQGSNTVLRYKL